MAAKRHRIHKQYDGAEKTVVRVKRATFTSSFFASLADFDRLKALSRSKGAFLRPFLPFRSK